MKNINWQSCVDVSTIGGSKVSNTDISIPGVNPQEIKRQNKSIYLNNEINDSTVLECIMHINDIARENIQVKFDTGIDLPIRIYINSEGGGVISAFSLVDHILQLKRQGIVFHTIIQGLCASAATLISIVGTKRFMTENSHMLLHQLSSVQWGKMSELIDQMNNTKMLMDRIKHHYDKFTNIPMALLEEILLHDLFFDKHKCIELGLVDE